MLVVPCVGNNRLEWVENKLFVHIWRQYRLLKLMLYVDILSRAFMLASVSFRRQAHLLV